MEQFRYGIRKEDLVAAFLYQRGWAVRYRPGSRGAYDLEAQRGRARLFIQVKSTRKAIAHAGAAQLHAFQAFSVAAEDRLCRVSNLRRALPIVAVVSGTYVWIFQPSQGEFLLVEHGWMPRRPLRRYS